MNNELSNQEMEARRNVMIAYALILAGFVTGIAFLAGGIWALISKDDARGTRFADHFDNVITVFIWGLILGIVFGLLSIILIGVPLLIALSLWVLFRTIKGLIRANDNLPYNNF